MWVCHCDIDVFKPKEALMATVIDMEERRTRNRRLLPVLIDQPAPGAACLPWSNPYAIGMALAQGTLMVGLAWYLAPFGLRVERIVQKGT
jgi:hypothetical protein